MPQLELKVGYKRGDLLKAAARELSRITDTNLRGEEEKSC
jgi:hypothetical protein